MGGGLAGAELAAAVAAAGRLGHARAGARGRAARRRSGTCVTARPDRAVAVNLLMPFVRRSHVDVCVEARIDVAVMAFGIDRAMIAAAHRARGVRVRHGRHRQQARQAIAWGADGLIAQGCEAGGHIAGDTARVDVSAARASRRPAVGRCCWPGGIANAQDTRAALAAGADGVVAGTRFPVDARSARPSASTSAGSWPPTRRFGRRCSGSAGPRRIAWWRTPRPGGGVTTTDAPSWRHD